VLFVIPSASGLRPATEREMAISNSEGKYTTIVIKTNGNVVCKQILKSGAILGFDSVRWRLKP
jgi:hypothetical protein